MRVSPTHRFALVLVLLLAGGCAHSRDLCDEKITWVEGTPEIDIPANDRLLICGDPNHAAWKNIPPNQSTRFLKNFLESQGYLSPSITPNYETTHLTVNAGPRSVVRRITTRLPVPPEWWVAPLETNLDQPLTKKTLDRIQNDAKTLLLNMGYPCAQVDLTATPEGTVELVLHPGPPLPFTEPLDLTPHPVRAGTLSRYEPFKAGDPFKMNQLTLAGRRIEEEGVASSAIYLPHCVPGKKPGEAPKMQVERTLSFGPKRLWDIGVGASTEEYPIAIFRWKNSRIWSSSSQLEVHGYASHLRQTAGVNLHWYYDNSNPRLYLEPSYKIEHRTERNYETFETTASVMAGKLIDVGEWTLIPEGGMTLHRLHVVGDLLPSRTDMFVSPGARLEARSNDYELYAGDPRAGILSAFTYDFIGQHMGASTSAHRFYLSGSGLYNYKSYTDPRWILGARYSLGTIFTADGSVPDPNRIPPDWFFLAGGDSSIRGFGRNALPADSVGAGTLAYLGLESRWPSSIPLPIEPLLFFDVAKLGDGNFSFLGPLYLAPGFGFRWGTPIGTLRMTLARGITLVNPTDLRWQFFISLGTEF